MLREDLAHIVASAVDSLIASGELPEAVRAPVEIIDTKQPEHGDYACNFALVAAKKAGMNPRELAERLSKAILNADEACAGEPNPRASNMVSEGSPPHADRRRPLIHEIDIAGPGFLNFRLKPDAVASYVPLILGLGSKFACSPNPAPRTLNVEFVSVNPNGPITVGSARGAAFGDTLCRVLEAAGNKVHREYYVNDGVNSEQMRQFARAIRWWVRRNVSYDHLWDWTNSQGFYGKLSNWIFDREKLARGESGAQFLATQPDSWYRARIETYIQENGARIEELLPVVYPLHDTSERPSHSESIWRDVVKDLRAVMLYYCRPIPPDVADSFFPTLPYRGAYVQDAANHLWRKHDGDALELVSRSTEWYLLEALLAMIERQREDLHTFGVDFDTWFSEQSLHDSGEVAKCIEELVSKGAADEEPMRIVLKMARGGVVEEVQKQPQTEAMEDDEADAVGGEQLAVGAPNPTQPLSANGTEATLWLRSTKFGDDMDRVLRRRDGRLTYIASDVAYHKDKLTDESGLHGTGPVDKLITILGPDHHGYINRLQAVVAALLEDPTDRSDRSDRPDLSEIERAIYKGPEERDACQAALEEARRRLEVVIFQIVRFVKDGKPAPMRKRDGNIYELRDLINELGQAVAAHATKEEQQRIGADVARFFYLMRSHDTHMDFDIDLATKQSDENPVFYAQYAHARISGVLRKAAEARIPGLEGWRIDQPFPILKSFNFSMLDHPREQALIRKILDLPFEVRRCAGDYGVHRLTTYAIELARTYHHFYDACRVIQVDQPDLSRARLALCEAARMTLKSTFDLLGVSAPERMDRADDALTADA